MERLHIVLFPMMAHGHTIPMLDMAKLFISRGLKATFISTPDFAGPIRKARDSGLDIGLSIVEFPPQESSLPDHITSMDQISTPDLMPKFVQALSLMQNPVERLFEELKPNCVVSDMFWPWTVESAAKFGFPRLVFHGTSCLALCASEQLTKHKPFKNVSCDDEPFVVPDLPHELKFVKSQVSPFERDEIDENPFAKMMKQMKETVGRSFGVVVNSFYELESDYADHYRQVLGLKACHIGPLLLCNIGNQDRSNTEHKSSIDKPACLEWLDSKKPSSVVYVCFGSMAKFTPTQLHEIAVGLEGSGQDFIWVVRKGKNEGENDEVWLPKGYEERLKGKGLIIRGWAPQVVILDHPAIGSFVTHCGWNSTLEGICAGVPMVTWPLFAEQFFNEKLVTDVVRTGVSVGNKKWELGANEGVSREAVAKAVLRVMDGEEALEMRIRAQYFKEMARKAVEEGGSSYNSLDALIEDLSLYSTLEKQE